MAPFGLFIDFHGAMTRNLTNGSKTTGSIHSTAVNVLNILRGGSAEIKDRGEVEY